MTALLKTRRKLITGAAATFVTGVTALSLPARAQGIAPTPTMRGGQTITCPAPRSSNGLAVVVFG